MADLSFCFKEKCNKYCNPTKHEINELSNTTQGAHAIIKVMRDYATDIPNGKVCDTLGIFGAVFNVLDWLLEPVNEYMFEYAGGLAEPEAEEKTGAFIATAKPTEEQK